ncbi:MAG: alpha/beta hydrolase [Ktedonobacteraceae bacterium]
MESNETIKEPEALSVSHRFVETNGLKMHLAEQGKGPLVVLCHGFPEFWYSWIAQMSALATAGYHVVVPDQRGYGQTDQPDAVEAYTLLHLVGDLVGLLDALGEQQAIIIGHDWGSSVAWHAALLRPDRFRAVASLSIPYLPRGPVVGPRATLRPTEAMRQRIGDHFYQLYFQEPGVAEAELERDVRTTIRRFFYGLSGDAPPAERWHPVSSDPHSTVLNAIPDPTTLPQWLTQEDLDITVETFQRSGFRGGLNWYRNIDRNWELLAAYSGGKISQPALLILGDQDPILEYMNTRIERLSETVPHLHTTVFAGCGHWIQQERAEEVNATLLTFLQGLK